MGTAKMIENAEKPPVPANVSLGKWQRYAKRALGVKRCVAPKCQEPKVDLADIANQLRDLENQLPEKEPVPAAPSYARFLFGVTIGFLFVMCVLFVYWCLSYGAGKSAGFSLKPLSMKAHGTGMSQATLA